MQIIEQDMNENNVTMDDLIAKADEFTMSLLSMSSDSAMPIVRAAISKKLEEHFGVLYDCEFNPAIETSHDDDAKMQHGFEIALRCDTARLKTQFIHKAGSLYVFGYEGATRDRRDTFVLSHYFDQGHFNLYEMSIKINKAILCSCSNLNGQEFESFQDRVKRRSDQGDIRRVSPYTGMIRLDHVVNDILDYDNITKQVAERQQ